MASDKVYVGAIDQGTTSTRFILYDGGANPVASQQIPFTQYHPKEGWCEHDPLEILATVKDCMEKTMEKAKQSVGASPADVKAIGVTNQRETTVVWDKNTGQPLHNAIVWLDLRTKGICDKLIAADSEKGKDSFREVTGLPISTYFSAFKLKWLIDNVPAVAEAAAAGTALFGTIDSWLVWNLTGTHATDVTNASRTMLMDLKSLQWHEPTAAALGIPPSMLPPILSSAEPFGTVTSGILQGVPVTACIGDQHAAMLGQSCLPGQAKNTYGTGCFMLVNTGEELVPSTSGLLSTVCFKLGKEAPVNYALEGSIAMAGAAVQWMQEQMGLISTIQEAEQLASSVADSAGVVFVPAFQGLLAPHWRPDARGTLCGLTRYSTKAHVARAVLECICFQVKEVLDAMRKDVGNLEIQNLRVDGGASQSNVLMQLQADVLGPELPVERPQDIETTAKGAAIAAFIGAGLWTIEKAFKSTHVIDTEFKSSLDEATRDARFARYEKAVQCSLNWA